MTACLLFLSIFAVYLSTVYPNIAPEDSGEFVSAAWSLGIPHASGYSLYVLLGKIAVFIIPFGNPAYRVNLLSALLGAGTAILLAATLKRLFPEGLGSSQLVEQLERERWKNASLWLTVFLWALVPGVWYLSLLAEVYVMELFLGSLLLWSAARWMDKESFFSRQHFFSRWSLSSLVLGLGISIHHTLVLWVPGLAGFLLLRRKPAQFARPVAALRIEGDRNQWPLREHWFRYFGLAVFFVALGFLVHFYLLFRAKTGPDLNTGDASILERWIRVILRQDYGTFSLAKTDSASSRWVGLWIYLRHMAGAFTLPGLAVLLFGAYRLARRSVTVFGCFAILWFISGPFFVALANPPVGEHFQGVMERFYPLSFVGLLLFLAWGLYEIGVRWKRLRPIAFLLVPLSFWAHGGVSGRGNLHARDFGVNLLRSLPMGSVLWDPGDSAAYSVMYQQQVMRNRTEIVPVTYHKTLWGQRQLRQRAPDLWAPSVSTTTEFDRDFVSHTLRGLRGEWIFAETPRSLPGNDPADKVAAPRYPEDAFPLGLVYRYFPSATRRLVEPAAQLSLARLTFSWYAQSADWGIPLRAAGFLDKVIGRRANDAFTSEIVRRYAEAHSNLGQKFAEHNILNMAEQEYFTALSIDPRQMEAYNNLGVLAYQNRDGLRAAAFFKRALERSPDNAELYSNLGQSYLIAGEDDRALTALQQALRLDSSMLRVHFLTAEILERKKLFEQSLPHWKKLRDTVPDDKEIHWRLAVNYAALGRAAAAQEALREYFLFQLSEEERSRAEVFQSSILPRN